jgi:hypothetical protein
MKNSVLLQALFLIALSVTLAWSPESAYAQRGGHGGGGGFHGGGGGSGFHGGGGGGWNGGGGWHGGGGGWNGGGGWHGGGGGWHGGGGGWHGGGGWNGGGHRGAGYYGGYRGGYWGYPGYGWGWGSGWGFGISFGWGGYWPGYSYGYGYAPAYPAPYYPYYYYATPASYAAADPPDPNAAYSENAASSNQALPPAPGTSSYRQAHTAYAVNRSAASHGTTSPGTPSGTYSTIRLTRQESSALRPEVQTAIRALQGMPPSARQAQLSRYASLSPEELEVVRYAADVPTN